MGMYQPKPYKQFNRALGAWVTVIPDPVELNKKGARGDGLRKKTALKVDANGKIIKNTWESRR